MRKPSINDFRHICIIQTAFLGDVVLTLPLAQAIKNYNPNIQISFVSTPVAAGVTISAKAIDYIVTYDKRGIRRGYDGIKFLSQHLKAQEVDCIISPHRSLRSTLVSLLTGARYSVGFDKSSMAILYSRRVKYIKTHHEIDRNLDLLTAFSDYDDIIKSGSSVEIEVHDGDKSFVESLLIQNKITDNAKLVVMAPGSVWETKRWKEYHFANLAAMLKSEGFSVVSIGSEDDKDLCKRITGENGYNFAGKLTIPQTLHLLSLASVLVTNDSAPTHFAGLVGTPTITIFGPTSPIFGFGPLGEKDISLELSDLKCKPCSIHGAKSCPIKTHECMENLHPKQVYEAIQSIVK
jgi:heptosyltransferase-2